MTNLHLAVGAAAIALAPALAVSTLAVAESAISDPAVPGSGYRIREVHQSAQVPMHSADDVDLSKPGDGYRIPAAPSAPSAPVMNDNGTYPSHSRHD